MAFVFVKNFGRETRLMVCECPKFFTSAKLHTPEQIAHLRRYFFAMFSALGAWIVGIISIRFTFTHAYADLLSKRQPQQYQQATTALSFIHGICLAFIAFESYQ